MIGGDMRYLTFALGKGRLVKDTMELLNKCGIENQMLRGI